MKNKYVILLLLTKTENDIYSYRASTMYVKAYNENDAKMYAINERMKEFPGFALEEIICRQLTNIVFEDITK